MSVRIVHALALIVAGFVGGALYQSIETQQAINTVHQSIAVTEQCVSELRKAVLPIGSGRLVP